MRYWIHRTRGVFNKNAVYYNPGMPYPMPDDEPPLPGSFECDEHGSPLPSPSVGVEHGAVKAPSPKK